MRQLADRKLLRVTDPERAAVHFMLLVSGAIPVHHGILATHEVEITEMVTADVQAFLHGQLS